MADTETDEGATSKKRSRRAVVLSFLLAMIAGGGSFAAVYAGFIPVPGRGPAPEVAAPLNTGGEPPDVDFLPIDPLVISLNGEGRGGHLRFKGQLEVRSDASSDVQKLMPRVVDVLNTYLRALEVGDLMDSGALVRLRSQMLRRIQIVTGANAVNDLLVMEFVLN